MLGNEQVFSMGLTNRYMYGGQRRKQRSGFYSVVADDVHDLSIHALKVSQLMELFKSSFDFHPHDDAHVKVQRTHKLGPF
jgi:hypothetical protein